MNRMRVFLSVIVALIVLFLKVSIVSAAATLSLSPSSASVGQGQAFTVSVNVNTGGDVVNAVEVNLTFPADKIRANYISGSGSAFDISAESTVGNGVVRIAKGKLPPGITGSRRVASVGFTALSQGSATISISGDSKVLRESDSNNILGGTSPSSVTIGAAVKVAKPPSQTQPGSPLEEQPVTSDTKPPVISDIKLLNLTSQTVSISWKTDEESDSQIEYGFSESRESDIRYFLTSGSQNFVTVHVVDLDKKALIPGHSYRFKVASSDRSGNKSEAGDQTFLLPGYSLLVTVVDDSARKIAGAKVKLPNVELEKKTGQNGAVQFDNLPEGNLSIIVSYQSRVSEKSIRVVPDKNTAVIVLGTSSPPKANIIISIILGLILVVVSVLATVFFIKKYKNRSIGQA